MTISVFTDGFTKLCISPDLNFLEGGCASVLEGQYNVNPLLATPIIPDKVIEVTSTRYIDDMFVAGSVLAESLKTAFRMNPIGRFYAIPRLDNALGVKAVYTLTVSGPATTPGRFTLYMGESQWNVSFAVASGDTANSVAALLQAAIAAKTSFPYVATVATNVVTLTAKNAGTVGNYLVPIYNWAGWQNYAPAGVSIATVRTVPGSVDPAPLDYAAALGQCCYSCYGLLSGDATWQEGLRQWIKSQWSCDKPQCFGHGFTFNSGTLGQVLATWDNQAELSSIPETVNPVAFPYLFVAAQTALKCRTACTNPEVNNQGPTTGMLSAVQFPASCTTEWTVDEMVQLRERGYNVLVPAAGGQGQLVSAYVTQDTTRYMYDDQNRRNLTWRDTSSRYLDAKTGVEVATRLAASQGLGLYSRNTEIRIGVQGTNLNLLTADFYAWAKSQEGALWSKFEDIRKDITIQSDFETAANCQGVPGRIKINMVYRRPTRITDIGVNLKPSMLDNCVR